MHLLCLRKRLLLYYVARKWTLKAAGLCCIISIFMFCPVHVPLTATYTTFHPWHSFIRNKSKQTVNIWKLFFNLTVTVRLQSGRHLVGKSRKIIGAKKNHLIKITEDFVRNNPLLLDWILTLNCLLQDSLESPHFTRSCCFMQISFDWSILQSWRGG